MHLYLKNHFILLKQFFKYILKSSWNFDKNRIRTVMVEFFFYKVTEVEPTTLFK